MRFEKFTKVADNEWTLREFTSSEDAVTIDTIGYRASLADFYQEVEFEDRTNSGMGWVKEKK